MAELRDRRPSSKPEFELPLHQRFGSSLFVFRRPAVLLVIAALGLAGAFIKVAVEMREGETSAFDNAILNAFRNPADPSTTIGPSWLYEAARDVTSLGSYVVLGILVALVVLYLLLAKKRFEAVYLSVAVISGVLVSNALKVGFNRPRPSFDNTPDVFTASFPSGHATMSAVIFLTLGAILAIHEPQRRMRILFITAAVILTLLVGVSRVYLGVHYPTDVIAGWCLGTAWAILWSLGRQWIAMRRQRMTS
jgi:undecaprenyl-diphosphatase